MNDEIKIFVEVLEVVVLFKCYEVYVNGVVEMDLLIMVVEKLFE